MKPLGGILILFIFCLAAIGPASATLTPLAEDEMAAISGGFGLAIPAGQTLGLTMSAGTLFYYDSDGVGSSSQGAYLSLCGLHLNGSLSTGGVPLIVHPGAFRSLIDGTLVEGLNFLIDDLTIRIDDFSIDAIRVGSAPGTGLSYGAIGMQDFVMQISGQIQMYVH
jgi:hypothetical protein